MRGEEGGYNAGCKIHLLSSLFMHKLADLPFEVCLESSHPRPAVNMIGLIHSTLSLLGRR